MPLRSVLDPSVVTLVEKDLCMHNLLKSQSSIEYLTNVTNFVASSLEDASCHLTKFTSYSQVIIDQLPPTEIAYKNASQQNIKDSYHKLFIYLFI